MNSGSCLTSKLIAAALLVLLATPRAFAATYYIDDSGSPACSDSNAGTSQSAPWCTIDKINTALASASAGDSFLLKNGDTWTYNTAGQWTTGAPTGIQIPSNLSGTAVGPITIGTYGAGSRAILDGNSGACIGVNGANAACPSGGEVSGRYDQYIVVNGLEIKNTTAYGIVFKNSTSTPQQGIVIENNYVHNTGPASDNGDYWNQLSYIDYQYQTDGVQILNNTIASCGGHNCVEVHGDAGSPLVQGNTCTAPWNHNCIDLKETVGALVTQNTVTIPNATTVSGSALYYEQAQIGSGGATFTRNLVYEIGTGRVTGSALQCAWGGTYSGTCTSAATCVISCKVYNNTFYVPGESVYTPTQSCGATITQDVRNNIMDGSQSVYSPHACSANETWTYDYNDDCASGSSCDWLWEGTNYGTFSAFKTATNQQAHGYVNVSPGYVNQTGNNYQLTSTSALINKGFSGLVAGYDDIGAFEYIATPKVYYVDNTGDVTCSDSATNPGTSQSSPWCTVAHVVSMASTYNPGDQILFMRGGVWDEEFDVPSMHGAAGDNIYFGSYGVGAKPVLDEQNTRNFCINDGNNYSNTLGSGYYLTFDGFECRYAKLQGIVFHASGSSLPGIIVENSYIHNTGPGASDGSNEGCDNGASLCSGVSPIANYMNQLDFESDNQGANGVQFIGNTVQHCGGHNCIQVHYDSGAVQVIGNTVGPGCVHGCLDVKGVGSNSTPALVQGNTVDCGWSLGECGGLAHSNSSNGAPDFYFENEYHNNANVTWKNNLAYDALVDYQFIGMGGSAGGSCTASQCATTASYLNNTAYNVNGTSSGGVSAYVLYEDGGSVGVNITVENNIWDGSQVAFRNNASATWDYNDDGGSQGVIGNPVGSHDVSNIDPLYVCASQNNYSLESISPLIGKGNGSAAPGIGYPSVTGGVP